MEVLKEYLKYRRTFQGRRRFHAESRYFTTANTVVVQKEFKLCFKYFIRGPEFETGPISTSPEVQSSNRVGNSISDPFDAVNNPAVKMCQLSARPYAGAPLYGKPVHHQQQRLDLKVVYIKLHSSVVIGGVNVPESLTLHCLPRANRTALELNGRRIHPSSSAFLTLQRSQSDERGESEIAYVTTDAIRTTDNLCFHVYMRDQLLISGTLERKDIKADVDPTWTLECSCKLEYSPNKPVHVMPVPPTLDVYVAGRVWGYPLILTQTVQMIPRRTRFRRGALDAIPEGNESDDSCAESSDVDADSDEEWSASSLFGSDCTCESNRDGGQEFELEGEEDSWFNSGLGFGLGIGLGMCVGVGLLVNSRHIRKRIL